MGDALSAEHRRALRDDGFVHLRAIADEPTLQAMRDGWERALNDPASAERGNNDGPGQLENEPAFRPCLDHPYVMSAAAELLDGDVVFLGFRGRNPRQGSGQQGFHVDFATPAQPDRQLMINVFWILDDMDEANGATRLIPGSHRWARIPDKTLSQRDARHPQARFIAARAGDVIIFTAHLWHAGSKNLSGAPRRIAMAQFGRREVKDAVARAYGANNGFG